MPDYYPKPESDNPGPAESPEAENEEESSGGTTLIPKSVFGGREFNPGDTIEFKVTHIYEDEIAVEPVGKESKSEEPSPADMQLDMMAGEGEMRGM